MATSFGYIFPSIRGVQARRAFYISMCPLRLIPKIFTFDGEELVPELRAQRILNRGRIPELARYILNNRDDYVFSALTASIDGDIKFIPFEKEISVIVARNKSGEVKSFPPVELVFHPIANLVEYLFSPANIDE